MDKRSTGGMPGEALFTPLSRPPLCRSSIGAACRGGAFGDAPDTSLNTLTCLEFYLYDYP
jgi:hypothetical protein